MFLIILILNISLSYAGDSCPARNTSVSLPFSSDISGTDCNPADKDTWMPDWKSPCDCLNNLSLPLKSSIRARELELSDKFNKFKIDESIENKMAESINSQIMFQFEENIRLDNLIKNGDLTEEEAQANKIFSPSCRLNKIKDLFDNIKNNIDNGGGDCDQGLFYKRSKLLFGTNNVDQWISNQTQKFKTLVTNDLSKNDFAMGLCIPYKSFQAMNSTTHLRSTYLKIAKKLGSHEKFIEWVKNRSNSRDVFDMFSSPNTVSANNGGILSKDSKFGNFSTSTNLSRGIANLQTDKESDLFEINEDDITRLLKTDPIFEKPDDILEVEFLLQVFLRFYQF